MTTMLAGLAVYFGLNFVLILGLGYLQTVTIIPSAQHQARISGVYSIMAIIAICVQAIVSIILLKGTEFFPVAALFLAFTLLCHHAVIHRDSHFDGEMCSCAPFQCKDVSNHETWVVASLVAGVVSFMHI